jgi:hypothetical protein
MRDLRGDGHRLLGRSGPVSRMLNRKKAHAVPVRDGARGSHWGRLQPPLVERLRDVRIYLRPQAPCVLEKDAHPGAQRLVLAE